MAKRSSIAQARAHLPSLVREVEAGKTVELTRRGEPVAVLIGRKKYMQLEQGALRFSEAYEKFTADFDLTSLGIDPDEVFSGVRDQTRGRDVDL